jgi:hypothetical protein
MQILYIGSIWCAVKANAKKWHHWKIRGYWMKRNAVTKFSFRNSSTCRYFHLMWRSDGLERVVSDRPIDFMDDHILDIFQLSYVKAVERT